MPRHRLDEIDALRGVVILLVLLSSYVTRYQAAIGHTADVSAIPAVGFLALQLFLAINAYRLLLDLETMRHPGDYLLARLLRYLPALWPAIALACLAAMSLPSPRPLLSAIPANLVMVADLVGVPVVDPSFWRLKIELLVSVTLGAVWFTCRRRMPPAILLAALLLEAVLTHGAEPDRQHTLTLVGSLTFDLYLPACAFGLALFHLVSQPRSIGWWCVAGAALALVPTINTPAHALAVLGAMAAFALAASGRLGFTRSWRGLIWLGQMSYPIYVVHQIPGFALIHMLERAGTPTQAAIFAAGLAAISCGALIHHAIERPARAHIPLALARLAAMIPAPAAVWTSVRFVPIRAARP